MTVYWWSHWFWITSILVVIITGAPTRSIMDTIHLKSLQNNKNYGKREPLQFPVAVQIDSDEYERDGFKIDGIINNSEKNIKDSLIKHNINININSNNTTTNTNTNTNDNGNKNIIANTNSNETNIVNSTIDITSILISNNKSVQIPEITTIDTIINNITDDKILTSTDDNLTENINNQNNNNNNNSNNSNNSNNNNTETSISKESIIMDEIEIKKNNLTDITDNLNNRNRQSKILTEYSEELKLVSGRSKNLLARSASTSIIKENHDGLASEALSAQDVNSLDAGAIFGICFAVIGMFSGVSLVGVLLYRRRYTNKPQTLSEPDSTGYIDDSTIRDNSDEMYSLDNDSFLNSLEAMTIQNYWTDNVKHTKL